MKLALFNDFILGIVNGDHIIDVSDAIPEIKGLAPEDRMPHLIDRFSGLRSELERFVASRQGAPLASVRLRAPLPRPSKILCAIANYWEHAQREARPLNLFLKSPDAVIGPGDTVILPDFPQAWVFQHEAELAVVIKGPAKNVKEADYRSAVFGYTGFVDVSAREEGRRSWRAGSFLGKSFDTFAPIGPWIATADEIPNPNDLRVKFWNNDELRHDYTTDDMEHRVPEIVAFASAVMTLNSGDLIACGTNHEGLGALQDGEVCVIDVEKIGRMEIRVADPLKRQWERGVYMGADSTAPAARRAAQQP